MDGMASTLDYQQSIEELQHSLLCTTLELQSVQMAVKEEKGRNEDNIKQLLQLLQVAFQERDEAKDHLQSLLNNIVQSSPSLVNHFLPNAKPENPPVITTQRNSSVAESDSVSETYNHQSYVSSSVDSYFDAVTSSPDLSNINNADSMNKEVPKQHIMQEYSTSSLVRRSSETGQIDPASTIIDRLVAKKTLPEKGRLLQTVMEAGPLLQTLLLAGPLPQWRNPPPLQSIQIPPFSINGHDSAALAQKPFVNLNYHVQSPLIASYHENYEGIIQTCSTSVLNFSSTVSSCVKKRLASSSGVCNDLSHDSSLILNMKHRKVQ